MTSTTNKINVMLITAIKEFDNYKAMEIILEQKYTNDYDDNGDTPLTASIKNSNAVMCSVLISKEGTDIEQKDKNGDTPLIISIRHNEKVICLLLLENGANAKTTDKNGKTPLEITVSQKSTNLSKLLFSHLISNLSIKEQ